MALVVLVWDGSDLLQTKITPELGLGLEDGFHGCRGLVLLMDTKRRRASM